MSPVKLAHAGTPNIFGRDTRHLSGIKIMKVVYSSVTFRCSSVSYSTKVFDVSLSSLN